MSGTVTSVVDGDTVGIRLDSTMETVTVRLEGIDCPERHELFGAKARDVTRTMLFDKHVQFTGVDVDRYNRLVARIRVDTRDSSLELVKAGLACHFTRYSSDTLLAAAEVDAREARRGFWAPGVPKPICAASDNPALHSVAGPFHGNRQSHVYHAPFCKNYGCNNCTVSFETETDARRAGYRPAGDCR